MFLGFCRSWQKSFLFDAHYAGVVGGYCAAVAGEYRHSFAAGVGIATEGDIVGA